MGLDHAQRAREILDAAVDSADSIEQMLSAPLDGDPRTRIAEIEARGRDAQQRLSRLDRLHAAAHVHATLAAAEQQRLANLIAVAQWNDEKLRDGNVRGFEVDIDAEYSRIDEIVGAVNDGLGIRR